MINDSDWTFIDPEARGGELFLHADAPLFLSEEQRNQIRTLGNHPCPLFYTRPRTKAKKRKERLSEASLISVIETFTCFKGEVRHFFSV